MMRRANEQGNVGLIVLGVLLLLGGIAALVLAEMGAVNYSEVGTARTIGAVGLGAGLLALVGGITMRRGKSG